MDVQMLLDQERTMTQLLSQENLVRQMRARENLMRQERDRNRWRVAEFERRAWAASAPAAILAQSVVLRPFDALVYRMEEQSRRLQNITDLTTAAIAKTVLDALKIGETYRRLIDPIPAIKNVLEPFTVTPAFDAMRYVTPLVEFERQLNILRDQSFSRFIDLRSKISDTILELSRVVKLAPTGAESVGAPIPGGYVDFPLSDVVDIVGEAVESRAEADWLEVTGFLQRIETRLCAVELRLSTPSFRDNIAFWLSVVSFLISVLSLCLQLSQNHSVPDRPQSAGLASPAPVTTNDHDSYAGPCP